MTKRKSKRSENRLSENLRALSKYGNLFENDPGPPQHIPLKLQFEDCRSIGLTPENLREKEPEFAAKYEKYLKKHPLPKC